jgi:hypothetical protein
MLCACLLEAALKHRGSDNVSNTTGGRVGVLKGFGNNWIIIQPV